MCASRWIGADVDRNFRLIVRRLLKARGACLPAFEHLDLALELAVARRKRIEVALLAHDGLTEFVQRLLQVREFDLDGLEPVGFGHDGTELAAARILRGRAARRAVSAMGEDDRLLSPC